MNWLSTTFLLLPALAGATAGWAVRHWALAGALTTGALAFLLVMVSLGVAARAILPLFSGLAVAGLVLTPVLWWRPEVSIWTRASLGMMTAFVTHFLFLQWALTVR